MLTKLKIENFKSFSSAASLNLAPLTLLAGANSSGKTTVIQSLLLLKQTVQYAPVTTPIALNGPLLKLGDFRDISNAVSDKGTVEIAWTIVTARDETQLPFFLFPFREQNISKVETNYRIEFYVPENKGLPPSQADLANLQAQ